MDTEEHIDLWFYRPLGFVWAKFFAKIGVPPNVVTVLSIILGVAGGILLYFGEPGQRWINYVGIFLIIWANTYDSADGQLARLTKQYSRLGRILDGVSGDLWFIAIYFALVFRELDSGDFWPNHFWSDHSWIIWTLAILAGASHSVQAAMADYYRQFHLYFLKGKDGSELDSVAQLNEQWEQTPWQGNAWNKITMWFYRGYTREQEALTPRMQAFRRALRDRFGDAELPPDLRERFRLRSLPLMKYTNTLSFNTRIIAMFIAVIINMPWVYFVFEIVVLNALLLYMILRHESICRKTHREVAGDRA